MTEIVGASAVLAACLARVDMVAKTEATALILGESGVGKEMIARRLHDKSRRSRGPMVTVNCAAVPRDLFESLFFGHVRGAFTGASSDRSGHFERADHGTLFLDEVGDIPPELQGKLLRALQEMRFERVGDERTRIVDVRIVAATNRALDADVAAGRFRRDLYYRLSAFPIEVPPLRERLDDLPALVEAIAVRLAGEKGPVPRLERGQIELLQAYHWPGNVRELQNVVERAFILGRSCGALAVEQALPPRVARFATTASSRPQADRKPYLTEAEFREFERENYLRALEAAGWRLAGPDGAAALMGVSPSTLASRLKAMGVERPAPDSLYLRLGGRSHVAAFCRDLFARVIADPSLGRFWAERSDAGLRREELLVARYVSAAAGGPDRYEGASMERAHAHLGVTADDWTAFLGHFDASCRTVGFEETAARMLRRHVEGLRPLVVRDDVGVMR